MAKGKTTRTRKRKATAKAARKPAGLPPCEVRGCGQPGLETHTGPNGRAVSLCGRCGEIARSSLRDAQLRAEVLDLAAAPFQKATARQALRRQERVHAAVR